MRTIEITTTQNVSIDYELAPLRDRILAFMLDFLIMGGAILVLLILDFSIFSPEMAEIMMYFTSIPVMFLYSILWETLNDGQSLGKKAMGIKIVKANGKQPSLSDYVIRWSFRMLDIYLSSGALATLLVSSSGKNQRLGDLLAGTIVIKLSPTTSFALKDILKINTLENYEPQFPQVRKLNEKDMLLIKRVAERYQKYPNEAHKSALRKLVKKLMEELEIQEMPRMSPEKFLKQLISDYIVLTR